MKNIFREYKDYISDNPQQLWFKRKLYGWGWTPATWQGWLITLIMLLVILILAFGLGSEATAKDFIFSFLLPIAAMLTIFTRIAYLKGEKPRWQWGNKKQDVNSSSLK